MEFSKLVGGGDPGERELHTSYVTELDSCQLLSPQKKKAHGFAKEITRPMPDFEPSVARIHRNREGDAFGFYAPVEAY